MKERKQSHNVDTHKEKMEKRKKLRREREPGFQPVYTKKQLTRMKELSDAEQRSQENHTKL